MSANIGNMPLNCLIFEDNIAEINPTLDDARKGAKDIVRMLESKQLKADVSKPKFVVIGSKKSRKESHIKTLKNFQDDFIMKEFQVSATGAPKSMIWLDSQMLKMKWRIIQLRLRATAKTMGKSDKH